MSKTGKITENISEISNISMTDSTSIFSMLSTSDIASKLVMLTLIIASIWSWAVIIEKIRRFRGVNKKMSAFENIFWSGKLLDQLYENAKNAVDNPLTAVFVSAMTECKRKKKGGNALSDSLKISHKERILQSMLLARNRELESLEKHLPYLATIGSSALLVGLFGTVLGIIHSFQSIALSKNASLAHVAPGIAEALLATAIGLLTAIPAVVFYNHLTSQLIKINNKVDDFIGELGTILSRAIDDDEFKG